MQPLITKPILLTDPLEKAVQGCREKDKLAQEQLYRHCYPLMIKTCFRYAGDMDGAGIIFNNAMLRVFNNIQQYREEGKLLGWIKTIVINCSLDFVRQQHRFKDQPGGEISEEETSIPPAALNDLSAKEIQKLITQLPKATATVFNLFIYEGFTHRQIAEALGISDGTSKWHVNEGRKLLKTKLETFYKRN